MVDETTTNKNYPLPHPTNIASQDVTRIATAITMIDADITECSNSIDAINSTVQNLDSKSLRIPSELVGQVDTELTNIQPRQYVVVNEDASGFSTVEGGGGEGGKKGEILVKKSDSNFDTMWMDPRAVLKKAPTVKETTTDVQLPNNCTMILGNTIEEEETDDLPRHGLTQRQINSDTIADSSYTYVLCDTIDDTAEEESDIATDDKFGRVKIGSGITVNNGEISVPVIGAATENDFGLVKIGSGLNVNDGVISAQTYPHADHENFGTIKPGSDFNFDSNGALQLANKNEDIIYQKSSKQIVDNGVIRIIPTCAYYRAFVDTDTLFSFDMSDFTPKADFSLDLEIVSDGTYVVNFGSDVIWELPCAGVNAGTTIIHFEKLLGDTKFRGTLKSIDTKNSVRLLTPDTNTDITDNYICGHNGCGWPACYCLVTKLGHEYMNFYNPVDRIWYIDFMRSTYVEYLEYVQGFDNWTATYFYIEGSVDGKNWKRLLTRENVKPTTYTLDEHGFFKHYRIRCKDTQIRYFRWYGFDVEDESYELQRVMPIMQTDSANGFEITSSGLTNGNLYNLTQDDTSSWANFETRLNGEYWVKYELPEAQSVDMIDLAAYRGGESDRMPTWFRIESSNDNENWTTILERAYLTRWYDGESRQYWIYNQTPYKFYRLLSIEQPTANFALSRFRLYKKIDGTPSRGFVPILSSNSEGGYEVSASSNEGSDHWPYLAFDRAIYTKWATTNHWGAGDWIQVKFPVETLCTTLWMASRNDQYYGQAPTAFKILGSVDGENFETIKTISNQEWTQGEQKIFDFYNTVPYLYYRVEAVTIQDGSCYFGLSEVNFGTQLREYKRDLTVKEYLLPTMNSNAQNGYEISVNSIYDSDWDIWRCFDRNTGTSWSTARDSTTSTIQITLPEAKICNYISVYPRSDYTYLAFGTMILYGSNDELTWTELLNDSAISAWTDNMEKTWEFENSTAYLYYKLVVTPYDKGDCVSVANINLFHKYSTREY